MAMSDYTPTPMRVIRRGFAAWFAEHIGTHADGETEFDRRLAKHDAEAVDAFITWLGDHVEDYVSLVALRHLAGIYQAGDGA